VIGLNVRLEHGDDWHPLRVRDADVLVDEVGMRVDDRKLTLRLAAEHVRGARGGVVEKLAEEHACQIINSSLE
jgi:hypothetical protein